MPWFYRFFHWLQGHVWYDDGMGNIVVNHEVRYVTLETLATYKVGRK